MLHIENEYIREHLLDGSFGIEMESLRVVGDGMLSQTAHPFPGDAHIVRDFSENQTEINTGVNESIEAAIEELKGHTRRIQEKLKALPEPELLWPFSNPPYIGGEKDVPIAQFDGKDAHKTAYREYLSDKYGRYKMTFSGSHVNFSFSEDHSVSVFYHPVFCFCVQKPEWYFLRDFRDIAEKHWFLPHSV